MRSFGVLSIALTLTILLATQASGQTASASINVSGQVSEAIFVSIAPAAQLSGETLPFTHSNLNSHTVRLSISTSTSGGGGRISIPLQLRSNVGYTLSASANLNGKMLSGLCVAGVRATGKYVARGAVNANNMAACEDATKGVQRRDVKRSGFSFPANLLQGQLISLNGTSDSPFNALEVLIFLEVETQTQPPQGNIELILSAAPERVAPVVLK
jgi:hypothetical protein